MTPPSRHSRAVVTALVVAVSGVAAVGVVVAGLALAWVFGLGARLIVAIGFMAIAVAVPAVTLHKVARRSRSETV